MLTDTDYHFLSGILYLAARSENVKIILGERILDTASETKRDVDIVIMEAGEVSFIAAEVKNHAAPLDVGHVEALCQKLNDMPSIKERYIVSTSGYTAPALRKAAHHNVQCLTLKRGQVPPFPSVDISNISEMTIFHQSWLHGPESWFVPKDQPRDDQEFEITDSTQLVWNTVSARPATAKEVADAVARTMRGWVVPPVSGKYQLERMIPLKGGPSLVIGDQLLPITHINAKGLLEVTEELLPLDQSHYLETSEGKVFVGAAMLEWRGHLTGVCVSDKGPQLISFFLPDSLRQKRPHQIEIKKAT